MIGRFGRHTLAVLLTLGAAALAAGPGPHPAAHASAQDGAGSLQVVLTQVSPLIPAEGDTVQIDAYVQNTTAESLDVSIDLRVTQSVLTCRSCLEQYAAGDSQPFTVEVDGAEAEIDNLGPGEIAPFRLRAPLSAFELGDANTDEGAHGLEVSAEAAEPVSAEIGDVTGSVRTFLTWMPNADHRPIQIAWLWPLADRPVRDESGTFIEDGLAASLGTGGRLNTLVAAAAGRPVTWAIDPDLVDTAAAMVEGYRLADGSEGAEEATGAAAAWLEQLRTAVGGQELLALPFADVDAAGLVHADRTTELSRAISAGAATIERQLGRPAESRIAWPAAGYADSATLAAISDTGHSGIVLDDAAVPLVDDQFTRTGRADIPAGDGSLAALLSDGRIASLLQEDSRQPGVGPLTVQRFLAETATIVLERPNDERAILVEPPRRWNPDPAIAEQLLAAYTGAPWIRPITLTELQAIPEPTDVVRRAPTFPDEATLAELPAPYLGEVADLGTRVDQFARILTDDGGLISSYSAALLRAESDAWSDGEGGVRKDGMRYFQALQQDLDNQVDQVRIISRGTVTLSSNSGTIPVTVANDLDQPVLVQLALTPRVGSRLSIDRVQPFLVDAQARQTVEVQASAVANGITTVDARLLTLDGEPLGAATQFNVRATNFGRVGFWIIGGAMALLFISAGIRIARRVAGANRRRPAHAEKPPTDERVSV